MGLTSWTPEGAMGTFFRTVGGYMPAPPALAEPPLLWGSEAHVEQLFAGTGIELEFERGLLRPAQFESADAAIEFVVTRFGPLMMARQLAEVSGGWPELRARLAELFERDEPAEYLRILGCKSR
jgi:hypothetical protein